MRVADPSLPDVAEGELIPLSRPLVTQTRKDCGCCEYEWKWQ
jgi:hypothetical protein